MYRSGVGSRVAAVRQFVAFFSLLVALAPSVSAANTDDDSGMNEQLLKDPEFRSVVGEVDTGWNTSQHAGEKSFEYVVENGVLTVRKTGTQPWGKVSQQVDVADVAGKTVKLSVELRGEFSKPAFPFESHTGISISVKGFAAGAPRLLGPSLLALVEAEPPIVEPGVYDWFVQSLTVPVPENATSLSVDIVMGLDGALMARKPALVVVSP